MLKRCSYLIPTFLVLIGSASLARAIAPQYESAFMRVSLAANQPAFVTLAVDSLGHKKLSVNPLRPPAAGKTRYEVTRSGAKIEYRPVGAPRSQPAAWTFEFSAKQIHLSSVFSAQNPPPSLLLDFNVNISRATLLGMMNQDGSVRLPALLHMPGRGTFRITSSQQRGLALGYQALRYNNGNRANDYVKVTVPAASASRPRVDYTLDVVNIYPHVPGIAGDPRFDGFRRSWLNIFQLSPHHRALANNATSDVCTFTVYAYSAIAGHTPPLAPGLTALDLIRQTLDRYLDGMKGYGLVGYSPNSPTTPYDYLDSYPSLIIAAWDYERGTNDEAWLQKNYAGIKAWATKMLAMDRDGEGLIEYPASGNSGSWIKKGHIVLRPSNWWDTIGFGHQDAYSNALAYHALEGMADLAKRVNRPEDAQLYTSRAEKLRSVYYKTFFDPDTGILAGWKSADGKLHDYYFTFVNGAAITYGLVSPEQGNQIMDHLLAKMKAVGYTHFEYGLPGNLIPVPPKDYVDPNPRFGYNAFQVYENGGASANYAYFTLEALYKLGRRKEADSILFPMLRSFNQARFQGRAPNGLTYDWMSWDGAPHGYEGLLVDGYLTLLAVLSR
jgi:Bacterial alpha-L-rhamnosidase 6 hairpin glycosidase domain